MPTLQPLSIRLLRPGSFTQAEFMPLYGSLTHPELTPLSLAQCKRACKWKTHLRGVGLLQAWLRRARCKQRSFFPGWPPERPGCGEPKHVHGM